MLQRAEEFCGVTLMRSMKKDGGCDDEAREVVDKNKKANKRKTERKTWHNVYREEKSHRTELKLML